MNEWLSAEGGEVNCKRLQNTVSKSREAPKNTHATLTYNLIVLWVKFPEACFDKIDDILRCDTPQLAAGRIHLPDSVQKVKLFFKVNFACYF
jgi:hypothetical protein